MKWISIWIMANSAIALLLLTYFYLNHELALYGVEVLMGFALLSFFPYILWKYNQMKFVEKRTIIIQILKD